MMTWVNARRRLVVAVLGAVIVAMVATSAVSLAIGVEDETDPGTKSRSDPTIPPATTGDRTLPAVDLSALIVPTPEGFQQIPDAGLPVAGKVDAATVVKDREDPAQALRALLALGLTDAFVRSWQKPDSRERITIRLYQFENEKGAAEYARGSVRTLVDDKDGQSARVPGADEAIAVDVAPQDGMRLVYAFGRRGRVTMVIAAVLPPPPIDAVAPVARQQLALLPQ